MLLGLNCQSAAAFETSVITSAIRPSGILRGMASTPRQSPNAEEGIVDVDVSLQTR